MSRIKSISAKMARFHDAAFAEFWNAADESASILKQIDPIQRRPWIASIVTELGEKQNWKCPLCTLDVRVGNHHVDHRIPFRWGGGNESANLQIVHPTCNQARGAKVSPSELVRYLEDRAMNL